MYTNSAYLNTEIDEIVDKTKQLLVTSVGNYKIETVKVLKTERPNGREDYQLLYIADGKLHMYFDGKEQIVTKGNMVLFRPKAPQMYYFHKQEKPETYWVHFTGYGVEELLKKYKMPEDKNVFFTGTSPDYQWIFRQMIQELQLKRTNFEDVLNINLQHLLLSINRYLEESTAVGSEMLDEIERATHFFNENYNKKIVVEQYSKEKLMTPCWFIKNFKQITKLTPAQYIVSLRITNAKNLLSSTHYNISQIAAAVGYDNALYFSRLFHKHTGMSPTEYRKKFSNF